MATPEEETTTNVSPSNRENVIFWLKIIEMLTVTIGIIISALALLEISRQTKASITVAEASMSQLELLARSTDIQNRIINLDTLVPKFTASIQDAVSTKTGIQFSVDIKNNSSLNIVVDESSRYSIFSCVGKRIVELSTISSKEKLESDLNDKNYITIGTENTENIVTKIDFLLDPLAAEVVQKTSGLFVLRVNMFIYLENIDAFDKLFRASDLLDFQDKFYYSGEPTSMPPNTKIHTIEIPFVWDGGAIKLSDARDCH